MTNATNQEPLKYVEGFLCRAWGETDLTEAAFEPTMEDVERFVAAAQFGERKLIAELTDLHEENVQMLHEQMKDLRDALSDMQGLWQIDFEIGGLSVEPVTFPLRQSAATPEASAKSIGILHRGEGGEFRIYANVDNLPAIYAFPPGEHSLYAATGERIAAPVQADKGAAFKQWQQHPIYKTLGSTDAAAMTHFDAGWAAKESAPTQQGVTPSYEFHCERGCPASEVCEVFKGGKAGPCGCHPRRKSSGAPLSASTSKAACVEPLAQKSEGAKDNAVQQAQQWAQEARTQRSTVLDILRYFGLPEHDWEALRLIKEKLQPSGGDAAQEAVDAARYRWLRERSVTFDHGDGVYADKDEWLDASVDRLRAVDTAMKGGA